MALSYDLGDLGDYGADPCEGVLCPPHSRCVKGVCLEDACIGVLCPPGTECSAGACVPARVAIPIKTSTIQAAAALEAKRARTQAEEDWLKTQARAASDEKRQRDAAMEADRAAAASRHQANIEASVGRTRPESPAVPEAKPGTPRASAGQPVAHSQPTMSEQRAPPPSLQRAGTPAAQDAGDVTPADSGPPPASGGGFGLLAGVALAAKIFGLF